MVPDLSRPVRNLKRWRDIQVVFLRYGFDILVDQQDIRHVRRLLREKLKIRIGDLSEKSAPERVRLMLEELGPTFVKLGQLLSSRSDLLTQEWIEELSKLHDTVPPFPTDQARAIIEEDFRRPMEEIFLEFSPHPAAAASLGQVHLAELLDHRRVMVKVQRPNISAQINADMEMMHELARLIENQFAWGKRYGVVSIVEEFSRTIHEEMDYHNEAANADRLKRNLRNEPKVHVPEIIWEWTSPRVLVMEAIDGIKITDLVSLDNCSIDRTEIASVFINSMFKQLFIDGFFHADPHPGNLLIDPVTFTLNYIDLGMMGSLLPEQRMLLGEMVQSILQGDSKQVVRLVKEIGITYKPINEPRLRREIQRLINRYLYSALEQIHFSKLLNEILHILFENGIRLPGELALALKTLVQGEHVARQLDPGIMIVDIGSNVVEQMVWQRLQPGAILNQISGALREFSRLSKVLPHSTELLLNKLGEGDFKVVIDLPEFSKGVKNLTIISNRMTAGLITAGMIVGSAIAMGVSPTESYWVIPILGLTGFIISIIVGILLVSDSLIDMIRTRWKK